jgi:hypothetical protein
MRKAMQLKSKIKNLALKNKITAQAVLQNFMLERLLERITVSKYKDIFILSAEYHVPPVVEVK